MLASAPSHLPHYSPAHGSCHALLSFCHLVVLLRLEVLLHSPRYAASLLPYAVVAVFLVGEEQSPPLVLVVQVPLSGVLLL